MRRSWIPILVEARDRGLCQKQVAQEQGVSAAQVSSAVRRWRISLARAERKPRPPSRDWAAEIKAAATKNETRDQFCRRVGCSHSAAQVWADRLKHTFAPRPRRKCKTEIAAMRERNTARRAKSRRPKEAVRMERAP